MSKYLFDVDGTLTPSRSVIDPDFASWFLSFCESREVYLVTGSDKPKTLEQVGQSIYNKCRRVYQCNGNEVYEGNSLMRTSVIELPEQIHEMFDYWLKASQFPHRSGRHVEERPGLVNFSIVGRGCGRRAREAYVSWDNSVDERRTIAATLSNAFGDKYNFQVAGETGIDITLKGRGKEQVLTDFEKSDSILFIGDKCDEGGNDHDIAQAVNAMPQGKYHNVSNWMQTWEILKTSESA